jgi:hypothetical protein
VIVGKLERLVLRDPLPQSPRSTATIRASAVIVAGQVDGSVTLAWLFHDEKDPYADAIVRKLPHVELLVPRLWHLEIANALLAAERRGRSSRADAASWHGFLAGLPIFVDGSTEPIVWS